MCLSLKGARPMNQWESIAPTLAAIVTGLFLLLNGRRMAEITARMKRQDEARQEKQEVSAAAISADEADRQRVSENMRWIVDGLRQEVAELRQMVEARNQQLDTLHEDIAQLRVIERQLRGENTALRLRVAELERQVKAVTP